MEPREYLRLLRRRWWVVVVVALVGVVAGFVTTPAKGQRVESSGTAYQATTTFIVDPGQEVLPLSVERAAFFATTGIVPQRVVERIGFDGAGAELASEVTATGDPALGTLQISTTQDEPEKAVEIARGFGEELVEFLNEQGQELFDQQLSSRVQRIEVLESDLAELEAVVGDDPEDALDEERRRALIREIGLAEQTLSELSAAGPEDSGLILLEEPAAIPISTGGGFSPPEDRRSRILLFGAIALGLGVGLALVVERFDTRVRSKERAEEAYGLRILDQIGLIPRQLRGESHLLAITHPHSAMVEDYRLLRATLSFALGSRGPVGGQVIAVTSALPAEGKSTTVANLAAAYAEHGDSVLVVNADFRRSTANELLDVPNGMGLSDLLGEENVGRFQFEALLRLSPIPGIRVLTQGRRDDHPATLLRNIGHVVTQARKHADVVLIDTAPVLAAYDVAEIIPFVDLLVVLSRSGKVDVEAAARAGEVIRRAGPKQEGLVFIGAKNRALRNYGSYYDTDWLGGSKPVHRPIADPPQERDPVRVGPD